MEIYYIQEGELLYLIVKKSENQKHYFYLLIEFLQDLEKLSKNPFLQFVPITIISILQEEYKVIIRSPNLFVRGPMDSVLSLLNNTKFNFVPYDNSKIRVFYLPQDNDTLELFIDDSAHQEWQFEVLSGFLRNIQQLNNIPCTVSTNFEIINILPLQHKIIIKSPHLFFNSVIIPVLNDYRFDFFLYKDNAISIYYAEAVFNTLELIVADSMDRTIKFQEFYNWIHEFSDEAKKHSGSRDMPLEIISVLPLQFKIGIRSYHLCFGSSINALLNNKGFILQPHPDRLSIDFDLRRFYQECKIKTFRFTMLSKDNSIKKHCYGKENSVMSLLKNGLLHKLKLK